MRGPDGRFCSDWDVLRNWVLHLSRESRSPIEQALNGLQEHCLREAADEHKYAAEMLTNVSDGVPEYRERYMAQRIEDAQKWVAKRRILGECAQRIKELGV